MNTISRKTLGLIIGLFIVTGILLYMAIAPTLKTTKPGTTKQTIVPTPTSAAQSILSFTPSSINALAGVPSTVAIELTTGDNNVRAVQLELSYDPSVLSNVSMKGGTFFPNATELIPANVNLKTGRISYAIGVATPKKGTGTVAMLTFTPRLAGASVSATPSAAPMTEVKFISLTKIAASGIGPSVLKTSSNLTVTVTKATTAPALKTVTISPSVIPAR
jgi:hypothetical protein